MLHTGYVQRELRKRLRQPVRQLRRHDRLRLPRLDRQVHRRQHLLQACALRIIRREHQSEHRQKSNEPGTKTGLRHRGGHVFFHGANFHERLIRIDLGECAAQCRRLKRGIACCAQYHRKLEHRQKQIRLAIGQVHFGLRVSAQAEVNITDYADDFHGRHFLFGQRA